MNQPPRQADRPARLDPAQLRRGLDTALVGRDIRAYDLVISTNDVLWELVARGVEEGTVVFAEEQTGGRGRLGRSWWSPRGRGIWMSVFLRPPRREGAVHMTTVVGALAAAHAVRDVAGLPAAIRWPNDVIVEGGKAAGVLVESRHPRRRDLVLGIGIDVNLDRADMPPDIAAVATSLSEAAGGPVDRAALARSLLVELDRWYALMVADETDRINREWRHLSATLGRRVTLEERGRRYKGEVIDLDAALGLALRLDRGVIRHFRGEHVAVLSHAG